MNNKIYILFLVFCQTMTSQTTESKKIFWDIVDYKLNPNNHSDIGYLDKVDFKMLDYHLSKIKSDSTFKYFANGIEKNDSIILSLSEKEYLIAELSSSKNFSWNLTDKKKLRKIEQENILEFLKADRKRELKIISKPIFIKNNKVACVFSAHLCCGEINGYVNISFYKKTNGKWKPWIPISEGSF